MNDTQLWEFTCKTCGGHELIVSRVWNILAGPESETWQEWGVLEDNHLWHFKFKLGFNIEVQPLDVESKYSKIVRVADDVFTCSEPIPPHYPNH